MGTGDQSPFSPENVLATLDSLRAEIVKRNERIAELEGRRTSDARPEPKSTCAWCRGKPIIDCVICQAKPSSPETYADDPPQRTNEALLVGRQYGMSVAAAKAAVDARTQEAPPSRMCESCETRPASRWCNGCIVEDHQAAEIARTDKATPDALTVLREKAAKARRGAALADGERLALTDYGDGFARGLEVAVETLEGMSRPETASPHDAAAPYLRIVAERPCFTSEERAAAQLLLDHLFAASVTGGEDSR